MSFNAYDPQNTTGLVDVADLANEPKSGTVVVLGGKTYQLTVAQENLARQIVEGGSEIEMPHRGGRKIVRQRVLDIFHEKLGKQGGAAKVPAQRSGSGKAKSKSDYVWVVMREMRHEGVAVVGVRRLKSAAKELAAEDLRKFASASVTELSWNNVGKKYADTEYFNAGDAGSTFPGDEYKYFIEEQLVPKDTAR